MALSALLNLLLVFLSQCMLGANLGYQLDVTQS